MTRYLSLFFCFLLCTSAFAQVNKQAETLDRAAALINANKLAEGEQALNQILRVSPNDANALNLLGTIRARQNNLPVAETLFTRAIRSNPNLAGAHINLAHIYLIKNQRDKSAAELKEVLRLEPANAEASYRLAWLMVSMGQFDECIAFVQAIMLEQTPTAPLLAMLGNAYARKSEQAKAVAALNAAIKLDPAEPSYRFALGSAWLKTPANLDEAEVAFREFLKLRPTDAQGQLHLGYVLLKQKRLKESHDWIQKSLQSGAVTPEAFYYLALIAQAQDEDARAVELFLKSIKQAPAFASAHIALGALYLKLKDFERAQQALETGVKLSPEDAKAHYNLAMLYSRLNKKAEAHEELEIVRRLNAEKLKREGKAPENTDDEIAPPSSSQPQ